MTINKDLLVKWIAALRSGKYEQCRGQFRVDNLVEHNSKYCCLGVACEVYKADKPLFGYHCNLGYVPIEVGEAFGFEEELQCHLVEMNDIEFHSFEEIADYLEKRYVV